MSKHTPIIDYHPWVFWVLDVLIIGPALLIFGLAVLWRMAHDEAKYRAEVSKKKFEKQLTRLSDQERRIARNIVANRPPAWNREDTISEVERYIQACLMDRRTA